MACELYGLVENRVFSAIFLAFETAILILANIVLTTRIENRVQYMSTLSLFPNLLGNPANQLIRWSTMAPPGLALKNESISRIFPKGTFINDFYP